MSRRKGAWFWVLVSLVDYFVSSPTDKENRNRRAIRGEERGKYSQNFNSSNTDGSLTKANSNSVLSPYEIQTIAQENKYLGIFSYFVNKLYVVFTH